MVWTEKESVTVRRNTNKTTELVKATNLWIPERIWWISSKGKAKAKAIHLSFMSFDGVFWKIYLFVPCRNYMLQHKKPVITGLSSCNWDEDVVENRRFFVLRRIASRLLQLNIHPGRNPHTFGLVVVAAAFAWSSLDPIGLYLEKPDSGQNNPRTFMYSDPCCLLICQTFPWKSLESLTLFPVFWYRKLAD